LSDDRAVTWATLFPADAAFVASGVPHAVADLLPARPGGEGQILVAWDRAADDLPDLAPYAGLVAVNGARLAPQTLAAAGFPRVRRFAVLPSLTRPKWLVPLDSPALAAAALRFYAPYRRSARLKHLGLQALARTGAGVWYRDQVSIAQRAPSPLEEALRQLFGPVPVAFAISAGTPGPARKPTLALLGPDGRPLGVAKLADGPVAVRLLQHEAGVLRAVAALPGGASLAPRLLFEGEVAGRHLTVQTVLPGRPAPGRLTPGHRRLLDTLGSGQPKPVAAMAPVASLAERIAALPDPWPELAAARAAIGPALTDLTLPATIVHGDFAPWNLRSRAGDVVAFDWEYAQLDGLPLADEVHHLLHAGLFLGGWSVARSADRLAEMANSAPRGLPPTQVRALQIATLLDVLVRRLKDGYDERFPITAHYRGVLGHLRHGFAGAMP
jgi:hypothetical protein